MEALQIQLEKLEQNLTSLEEDYAERVAGELLSPETFVTFIAHCLQFSNIIRTRVNDALKPKEDKEEDDDFMNPF